MTTARKKFETGLVRELAAILREADLGEIEIEHEGLRIRVKKPDVANVAAPAAHAAPAAAASLPAEAPSAADGAAVPDNAVTSPMVGTAYLSPEPGAKVFVNIGDKVKEGDTIMLVEAMKTFNPVTAPSAGRISAILINDAQPVEFGEPLFVID